MMATSGARAALARPPAAGYHVRPPSSTEPDPTSYSNWREVYVTQLHLELTADFASQRLSGEAVLTLTVLNPELREIVLDTNHLDIRSVHHYPLEQPRSVESRQPLSFSLGAQHAAFGQPLHITAPPAASFASSRCIVLGIEYSTTGGSVGLQWLSPAQTAGKQHPYMFTQFQAIHARSAIPLQDSPGVKFPYTASITVPAPLVALMSAPKLTAQPFSSKGDTRTYAFSQPVPVPSYLLAMAIGALESRRLGPRSSVWSEAETVEAGAWEFAETEQFLTTAESIVGPYVWGDYDILLLPPSFPYGGMENTSLTFLTPTLIAGDRSLVSVVAHEASHSWMGNLVGCANWQHFWCNEGFCVFLERKILKALKGEKLFALDAIIGRQSLIDSIAQLSPDHPYTVLNVQLADVDPDDAFSSVPYEKGFAFLYHLEQLVGGDAAMNPFLRAYCQRFAFSTVTSQAFQSFFLQFFAGKAPQSVLDGIDWQRWLHEPGLPPDPHFDRTLVDQAETLAKRWVADTAGMQAQQQHADISAWDSDQVVMLLQQVKQEHKQTTAAGGASSPLRDIVLALDAVYHFTNSRNAEIRFAWLSLVVAGQVSELYPAVLQFITEQGRMKYIRPLYRQLYEAGGQGRQLAVDTFSQHRGQYHAIAQKMVSKELKLQ